MGFMADSGSSDEEISASISVKPPVIKKPEVDVEIDTKAKIKQKIEKEKNLKYKVSLDSSSDDEDTLKSMRSKVSVPGIKTERREVDVTIDKDDLNIDLPSAKVTVPSVDIKGGIEIDGGIDIEKKLKTSVKSEQ